MIIRVIHEAPGLLAAAGIISATMPTPAIFDAKDSYQPLPVALLHGTRDPIVPYEGGMASLWGMRPRGTGLSAPDTARYFAERNGMTAEPTIIDVPAAPSRTSVTATRWVETGHPSVTLYTVTDGGHTIPNPTKKALFILGRTNRNISAAEKIWSTKPMPPTAEHSNTSR